MKQPYRIGELRERVTLRRYTQTPNEYGTLEEPASDIASGVPAIVRPMSGSERDRGEQTEARANYLVVIRYRELTEKDSIIWRGNELNIRFISDRGPRSRFLELECERGAPQ